MNDPLTLFALIAGSIGLLTLGAITLVLVTEMARRETIRYSTQQEIEQEGRSWNHRLHFERDMLEIQHRIHREQGSTNG